MEKSIIQVENHSYKEKEDLLCSPSSSYQEKIELLTPSNIANEENEEANSELSKSTRAVRAKRKLLTQNLEELFDPCLEKKKTAKKLKATRMKTLNMGKKMEIIEMIDQKISSKLIRSIYRLKSSTFYDIKKSADKIREYAKDYQSMQDQRWERKTMRKMQFPEIETAVYDWFLQQKSAGVIIRGIDIRETAKMFALHFKEENFKASAGWLFQFRKRHSLITRSNKSKKKVAAAQKAAAEEAASLENIEVDPINKLAKNASKSNNPKHGKYPRARALTVGQKMKVVEMIEEKVSPKKIMNAFKLKRSTFYDIKRDANKIKEFTRNNDSAGIEESSDRRSMKKMGYPEIDKSTYSWYLEQKAAGVPVRGVDIQHAAEKIAVDLNNTSFKASSGWLFRFRKRHGLTKLSIVRKKSNKAPKKKNLSEPPPSNASESVAKQTNPESFSYLNPTPIVSGSLRNNSINVSEQRQITLPSQSLINSSSSLASHGHPNLIAHQHQYYHKPDNSQNCLPHGQQHQPLLLSTRTLQPITTHQPMSSQHPITLSSRHPLQLANYHSSLQNPLQMTDYHHNIQPQHQPIQFGSHQQLTLTNHQQFNLNSLNNQYQVNSLSNPYHHPSK